jgi:hypothetical protein
MTGGSNGQSFAGIMGYASEKLGIREGECLFLLPRIRADFDLKPALF